MEGGVVSSDFAGGTHDPNHIVVMSLNMSIAFLVLKIVLVSIDLFVSGHYKKFSLLFLGLY